MFALTRTQARVAHSLHTDRDFIFTRTADDNGARCGWSSGTHTLICGEKRARYYRGSNVFLFRQIKPNCGGADGPSKLIHNAAPLHNSRSAVEYIT